jgi:uncharacterized protein (DUF2235 family)
MKKIVLFSDGTGNSASSAQKTNVWRAYKALDLSPASKQIAYYDNGVGTSSFTPTAMLGKAFGWGLAHNVRDLYGFLCRTYDVGDEIYGFGFSRGAFTMRIALAFIASQGIIDRSTVKDERDFNRLIATAYRQFRTDNFTPSFLSFFLRPVRDGALKLLEKVRGCKPYDPTKNIKYPKNKQNERLNEDDFIIKFVGVWDTVDAYGLPLDELTRAWDMVVWPLTVKDRNLSARIQWARHALSLDEQRESFEPMLWNERGAQPAKKIDDEHLSQVWFPGVHANIGGGYPDDIQAFTSLNWMLDQSEKNNGLVYIKYERNKYQVDTNGPINDNRQGVGSFYRYAPRNLEMLCKQQKPGLANWLKGKFNLGEKLENRTALESWVQDKTSLLNIHLNSVDIKTPKIHHSVFDRVANSGDAYAPINIPGNYALVDGNNDVHDIQAKDCRESELFETPEQANQRRKRQSYVWNKVWARKLLYFITIFSIIWFVAYPYFAEASGDGSNWLFEFFEPLVGTLSSVIRVIPGFIGQIPGLGFAGNWGDLYASYPYKFIIGFIGIGILLWLSLRVNAELKSEMRLNWWHVTESGNLPEDKASAWRKGLARFLEGDFYREKIIWSLRVATETVAVVFFIFILIAMGSRLSFTSLDGFGKICDAHSQVENPDFGKEFVFNPQSLCFATGLEMVRGQRYEIDFRVSEEWADENIKADVDGWGAAPWYMSLFTPIRRHLSVGWYQPVARINNKLFDRYPLHENIEQSKAASDKETTHLRMQFKARRSGELFIYLNDAVFFAKGMSQVYYDNNLGKAYVTVLEKGNDAGD